MKRSWGEWALVTILVGFLATASLVAQEEETEEEKKRWSNKTEFGFTSTSGNADSTNLSFGNNFKWNWEKAEFLFDVVAIKSESEILTYELDNTTPVVVETPVTVAEIYGAVATYRRDITQRLFWYVNGRWYRNQPSGIQDRYRGGAGIGYKFIDGKKHTLLGELGATYTDETQTDTDTLTYSSSRILVEYDFKISDTAELSSDLEGLSAFDDSENWQVNWVTSVTASLTSQLALKVSYLVLYNNLPPSRSIPPGSGVPPGAPALDFPASKSDKFLTASVVLNF